MVSSQLTKDYAGDLAKAKSRDLLRSMIDRTLLTFEDAIDLLQSGIPILEIRVAYPTSYTTGQLAALKAHYVTIGKFADRHTNKEVIKLRNKN